MDSTGELLCKGDLVCFGELGVEKFIQWGEYVGEGEVKYMAQDGDRRKDKMVVRREELLVVAAGRNFFRQGLNSGCSIFKEE